MVSLAHPAPRVLKAFMSNFMSLGIDRLPLLGGASRNVYDNDNDLFTIRVHEDQDRLSHFVQNHLGLLFQACPHVHIVLWTFLLILTGSIKEPRSERLHILYLNSILEHPCHIYMRSNHQYCPSSSLADWGNRGLV